MANRRHRLGMDDPTMGCALPRQGIRAASGCTRSSCRRCSTWPNCLTPTLLGRSMPVRGAPARCSPWALLGPRVSEFCAAQWRHLSEQGLFIPEAKTSAGRRHLELPAIVRAALNDRRARLDPRPDDFIWATAAGTRRHRANVRGRLLAPVVEIAAPLLEARGHRPLPERVGVDGSPTGIRVTPHMFRRTAMTYWAWAGPQPALGDGTGGSQVGEDDTRGLPADLPSRSRCARQSGCVAPRRRRRAGVTRIR